MPLIALLLSLVGCSTQKNTAASRWWHSFTARYNIYYNGSVAYVDGSLEKENGHHDNFTETLPLYPVGNKNSRELGKANFDRAIEKCQKAIKLHGIKRRPEWRPGRRKTEKDREWLSRKEYNPFLWKAWMLMGRSQFHSGAFEDAASTFSYMSRLYQSQPSIHDRARAWLAKCYVEQGWLYDAEDVIRNMRRDTIHWQARKEWDYTYADYYLHTKEYDKAIPYLRKVIKHEMRRKQKARQWFLLGQLYEAVGNKEQAYQSYRRVLRQHPPYEVEFNARVAMTEVMAGTQVRRMIAKLRRMAANENNKDYLDQVYYAIGNIYLAKRDTLRAIDAYEKGNKGATRRGIEKGVLLLKLGNLYWEREKYNDAQRCYGEAIGLLDKEREDYEELSYRSKVLDELVPYTDAVALQDSLQALARLPKPKLYAAIDRVIDALRKKEKEEAERQDVQNGQNTTDRADDGYFDNQRPIPNRPSAPVLSKRGDGQWYFYNQMAVSQGKAAFERLWGKRENVDNWQRANKTVVAFGDTNQMTESQIDSLQKAEAVTDSLSKVPDSAQNDPHKRAYYLAQIPFTDRQVAASNLQIMDGLFHSGVIFKDKLDNLKLSEKALRRLVDGYPSYEHIDEAYYHLFLLYSRLGQSGVAARYIQLLKTQHPKSEWTVLLTSPHFLENARFGAQLEDSLYAATYDAFKAGRYDEVRGNARVSSTRFPLGANRDKFLFIGGLGKLNGGDADGCLADMRKLVEQFPESGLSNMAGMIINGVQAGRRLRGGKFDVGDVWSRRSAALSNGDSVAVRQFSNERNTDFTFVIAYHPDSVRENQLLYQVAKYDFTRYMVRNFDITIAENAGLHLMKVAGFRNFDEALQYARAFRRQNNITSLMGKARLFVISDANLQLLGTTFSYDDYDRYYDKHFAPLKVSTFQLLTEPAEAPVEPRRKPTAEEIDHLLDDGAFIDNGLETETMNRGTLIVPQEDEPKHAGQGGTVIPCETSLPKTQAETVRNREAILAPRAEQGERRQTTSRGQPLRVPDAKTTAVKTETQAQHKTVSDKPQPRRQGETIVYFDNNPEGKTQKNNQKTTAKPAPENDKAKKKAEPKIIDFGDEYYDLGGF